MLSKLMCINSRSKLLFPTIQGLSSNASFSGLTSEQFMKSTNGINEPILEYRKDSKERVALHKALNEMSAKETKIPLRIGGEKVFGKMDKRQPMPFDHKKTLATYSQATSQQIQSAIEASVAARDAWDRKGVKHRADIMLHAADLCANKYRMQLNAATMLGQGKTIVQAEIDSACEVIDFLRFNAMFALNLDKYQPNSTKISKNSMIYRALEGFIASISPFNFTAIGANLASCPALMGNAVLWKPASTAIMSNYIFYEVLEEAGVPPALISFLPTSGQTFGDAITHHRQLAAINFTGSVPTFQYLWRKVAENLDKYQSFPRLVGECGGKNFHFIHKSASVDIVASNTIRAAFEYQGQKCSACSRLYVPESLWPALRDRLIDICKKIKYGNVMDGSVFMSSVIDKKAFDDISGYITHAKQKQSEYELVYGGKCDDSVGYFIEPTIFRSKNPTTKLLQEEIFGPVLTAFVYPDSETDRVLHSLKDATPFGLTGAVWSSNKEFLCKATGALKDAVGNLYLNDKCTGAVVGQQPFGGARMSGTNDKAGSAHYLLRWTSPQTIKETSTPSTDWRYPSMD